MTPTLENYTLGRWTSGGNTPQELLDASTGEVIALANTEGFDFEQILDYGRRVGNPKLRQNDLPRAGPDAEGAGLSPGQERRSSSTS